MKIWNQIKEQFHWYKKYRASIQQRLFNEEADRTAAAEALKVLAKYESLTASLPLDHELSTQQYWKDYADHKLLLENESLRSTLSHVRKAYSQMTLEWQQGVLRYGVQMYGKWQPIETAPKDVWILATEETGTRVDQVRWVEVPNGEGYNWITLDNAWQPNAALKYWMALPEGPK